MSLAQLDAAEDVAGSAPDSPCGCNDEATGGDDPLTAVVALLTDIRDDVAAMRGLAEAGAQAAAQLGPAVAQLTQGGGGLLGALLRGRG